jgi:RecA/RadA recombinase
MGEQREGQLDQIISLAKKNKWQLYTNGEFPVLKKFRTGIIYLDKMLDGGIPLGRIIEIFGPNESGKTTLALHLAGEVIKQGELAAYLDMEYKTDPKSSVERAGVRPEGLIYGTPENGEEAVEMIEALCRGGARLVIVDSLADIHPKSYLEKDINDPNKLGAQAQFITRMASVVKGVAHSTETTILYTNQLRTKITSMGGCFPPGTRVWFADGSLIPIEEVYAKQLEGPVLSIDETGAIVSRPITNWFLNGETRDWYLIHIRNSHIPQRQTGTHVFVTTEGEKMVKDLKPGDLLRSFYSSVYEGNKALSDALDGMLASGSMNLDSMGTQARLVFYQSYPELDAWKEEFLGLYNLRIHKTPTYSQYKSSLSYDLSILRDRFYSRTEDGKYQRIIPSDIKQRERTALLWYLESLKELPEERPYRASIDISHLFKLYVAREAVDRAVEFWEKFCVAEEDVQLNLSEHKIEIGELAFENFSRRVASYTPYSLQRALHPCVEAAVYQFPIDGLEWKDFNCTLVVEKVEPCSSRKPEGKYDVEVEGNHNYFVGSHVPICVHNSEDTAGGYAAKHMSILRLEIRRKEDLKDASGVYGICSVVKFKKNQIGGSTYRDSFDLEISFADGIDTYMCMKNYLEKVPWGIAKAGAWYSWKPELAVELGVEERIGQGGKAVTTFFKNHPELYTRLYERILESPKE